MGSLCLSEVVDYLLVRVSLLDIIVVEVNYSVTVREHLSLDSVVEDNLLLAVLVDTLDLAIVSDDLLYHPHVWGVLVMVWLRELHIKLLVFVAWGDCGCWVSVWLLGLVGLLSLPEGHVLAASYIHLGFSTIVDFFLFVLLFFLR